MTTHIYDELPMLLTGEADRATVALAADHLRECTDCQQELVSALIAHASLSSAVRFAPELRASLSTTAAAEEPPGEPTELPDLSSIFEMAKQEARPPRHAVAAPRTRPTRARWLAAAAVGGILVGGGAVVAVQNLGGSPHTAPAPYRRQRRSEARRCGSTPAPFQPRAAVPTTRCG
jgi:hypothetical protein